MNVCGSIPATVQIRNIDAVDVAATNLSCSTFNVNGENVTNALTNVSSATPGTTNFTGTVTADNVGVNTGGTLSFAGTSAQQKINLYSNTYGVGVSANQLNLIGASTASLVYYTGGTNNTGTERFRVTPAGNVTIPGNLTVTGTVTADFRLETVTDVSANTGTTVVTCSVDSLCTKIVAYVYSMGVSGNTTIGFRVGPSSGSILSTTIYNYARLYQIAELNRQWASASAGTSISLTHLLNNNEKVTGKIELQKLPSAWSFTAEFHPYGWSDTSTLLKATGQINYSGNIGAIQFLSATNFNVAGSTVTTLTMRQF